VASTVASTVSIGDGTVNLAMNWKDMSPQDRIVQASQLAFSVGMLGYQAHQAGGIQNIYDPAAVRAQMIRSYARSGTGISDAMMEAVRTDISAGSDHIKSQLSTDDHVAVKRVIIGGGPQGGTLANELNRIGQGAGTLIVDASRAGDNNFGDVRNFRLNSETGK